MIALYLGTLAEDVDQARTDNPPATSTTRPPATSTPTTSTRTGPRRRRVRRGAAVLTHARTAVDAPRLRTVTSDTKAPDHWSGAFL